MPAATRTDIHSPSNFDPADYEYVGAFDSQEGDPGARGQNDPEPYTVHGVTVMAFSPYGAEKRALNRLLDEQGFPGGNWETKAQCDHCGARIRYVCVFRHNPSGQHIATGETCADERFGCMDRLTYDVKRLRERAAAQRERERKAEEAQAQLEANPGLAEALELDHNISRDLKAKLYKWGSLSERQIWLAFKLQREATERVERAALPEEVHVPAPTGKVTFEGKVVSRKGYEGDYGWHTKVTVKMTEANGATWLVWVTEPSKYPMEVGDTVRMTATLTRSDRDEHFAFGKRPSKVTVTKAEEVQAETELPDSLS